MYKEKSAFTLTEAIFTILIVGVLAAIVIPRLTRAGFITSLGLRSATSQIASDMRYTRHLAITNSVTHLIKFDCAQKEYKIYLRSIAPGNQIGVTKKIPSDITCSGTDQFTFGYIGSCTFAGGGLSLFLNTSQYDIKVDPPLGAVLIEKVS